MSQASHQGAQESLGATSPFGRLPAARPFGDVSIRQEFHYKLVISTRSSYVEKSRSPIVLMFDFFQIQVLARHSPYVVVQREKDVFTVLEEAMDMNFDPNRDSSEQWLEWLTEFSVSVKGITKSLLQTANFVPIVKQQAHQLDLNHPGSADTLLYESRNSI